MRYRDHLPQLDGDLFLTDGGIETVLGLRGEPRRRGSHPGPARWPLARDRRADQQLRSTEVSVGQADRR